MCTNVWFISHVVLRLEIFIRIISNASDSMCSVQDWSGHTALYLPSSELWKHQTPTHCRLCERMKDPSYWVTFNREMMSPLVTGLVTLLSLAPSVVSIRPYVTCVGCETFMECFLTCPVADYPGVNKWDMSFTKLRYERLSWVHTKATVGWADF